MQFEEISATINNCGERGPQGPVGPQGPAGETPDLTNYAQDDPINITSNGFYDEEQGEGQNGAIHLNSKSYLEPEGIYGKLDLDGAFFRVTTDDQTTPGAASVSVYPGGVKAEVAGWPAYESATALFENDGVNFNVFWQDENYENHPINYSFAKGFAESRVDSEASRALNTIMQNQAPPASANEESIESQWPIGVKFIDTSKNDIYHLVGKTTEMDPETGINHVNLHWAKVPQVDVLWTNPNPSVAFQSQDVTVSEMTKYRWVMIEFGRIAPPQYSIQSTVILRTDFTVANTSLTGSTSTKMQFITRNFTQPSTGIIHFYSNELNQVTRSTGVWDAITYDVPALIPLRIFGIK